MPELPEVEAVARSLRPLIRGRTIRQCRVFHGIAVRPQHPETLCRAVEGQRVERVERRGKYLLLRLTRGCVVAHFRLDGQLLWLNSTGASAALRLRDNTHIDVALRLNRGLLGFVDRRHFGRMHWFARPEESPGIRKLGMDALSKHFTAQRLRALLHNSRRPLKLLLMDQTRIAGLGNIYTNEALWRARLDPRRRAQRVTPEEARRLHKAIVCVLRGALECCLDPPPDFAEPRWWFQGLEKMLHAYGRKGEACRRCKAPIRRILLGGRATYYCKGCQQ